MSWSLHISSFLYATIIFSTSPTLTRVEVLDLWEVTYLRSVTYFEDINQYYKTRREQTEHKNPPMEPYERQWRIAIKKTICKRVFTSHFFRAQKIKWVDTDRENICKEVKDDHREVFYDIFNEYEYQGRCLPISGQGYDYENMYRVRRVRVDENEEADEHVFACLARNRETRTIKEYFVSRAYNVNITEMNYPIAGRFIFLPEENNSQVLALTAMAEPNALEWNVVRGLNIFSLIFCTAREYLKSTDTEELDPVCSLSPANKLRLCSAVFSASPFRKRVRFSPVMENVEIDCQRKTVAFLWGLFARRQQEWVIGCKARTKQDNRIMTYYVSRGHEANTIFVYTSTFRQNIALFNFYCEVSVVRHLTP